MSGSISHISHSGYEDVDATVVIQGGPPGVAHEADAAVFGGGDRVKVPHLGGYEHYERVAVAGDGHVTDVGHKAGRPSPLVYRWMYRTAVAE